MKLFTGSVLCMLSAIQVFADDVYTNSKTVREPMPMKR